MICLCQLAFSKKKNSPNNKLLFNYLFLAFPPHTLFATTTSGIFI